MRHGARVRPCVPSVCPGSPQVCAFHGVSPRDRWLCVLPGWQMNVNVNVPALPGSDTSVGDEHLAELAARAHYTEAHGRVRCRRAGPVQLAPRAGGSRISILSPPSTRSPLSKDSWQACKLACLGRSDSVIHSQMVHETRTNFLYMWMNRDVRGRAHGGSP